MCVCVCVCVHARTHMRTFNGVGGCNWPYQNLNNFHKLNDSNQAIRLLNPEISLMRKAVLHNCKALDTLQPLREISVL